MRIVILSVSALMSLYSMPVNAAPSIGVMGALAVDGSDQGSRFEGQGPGYGLQVPILFEMSEILSLRTAVGYVRTDISSRLTWQDTLNGDVVRFYEDGHAFVSQSTVSCGLEVAIPLRHFEPMMSVGVGVAAINAEEYGESFTNASLSSVKSIERTKASLALLSEVNLGLRRSLSSRVALFLQTGYSVATVPETNISTSSPELGLRRERIGLNTAHFGFGVQLTP